MRAFLFPGQGSQKLKMGLDLYQTYTEAKEVFEEVDSALSQNLSSIIFGDDAEALNKTENTQPALFAVSMATLKVIENQSGKKITDLCGMVAGHSLGEYSALCAADVMPISVGARLLKVRAKVMAEAVPAGVGAMMAVIGLDIDGVREVCARASDETAKCSVANDNCPGQIVISGHKSAIEKAEGIAKELGARKSVILPVSVPAHCPLMMPAKEVVEGALSEITFKNPVVPFVSNRTAEIESEAKNIKEHLALQMVNGVRFRESVDYMLSKGIDSFTEIGSGNVLSGLVKRCTDKAVSTPIGNVETIAEFLKTL
ncbi:MAG: ACP S-malonyltransferase [Alphaproteobacteria bacterium]|nr:ACP S-malonyltransferase [Alphaproteobacteria bacterium]